jgi:hypothetical protein
LIITGAVGFLLTEPGIHTHVLRHRKLVPKISGVAAGFAGATPGTGFHLVEELDVRVRGSARVVQAYRAAVSTGTNHIVPKHETSRIVSVRPVEVMAAVGRW